MSTLKNKQAEFDAQRVAQTWLKHGKTAATKIYRSIIERVDMKNWEGVVFSNRVHEILYENGATYTIADVCMSRRSSWRKRCPPTSLLILCGLSLRSTGRATTADTTPTSVRTGATL